MRSPSAWLMIGILVGAPAVAEPALSTDRPGQSDSPTVVSPGTVQIETGWTRTHDGQDGVSVESDGWPGTLVRIGLVRSAELRIGWTGIVSEEIETGALELDDDGSGDTSIAAKFRLRDERGRSPEVALVVGTTLPTGADAFTSDRADPSIKASLAHSLTDRLGLGYNLGLQLGTERKAGGDKDTQAGFIYTTSLGIQVTDRLAAFVELFGNVPSSAGGGPSHSADGGLSLRVRNNLQLDLSGGVGVNDRADDWFASFGVSVRLPR